MTRIKFFLFVICSSFVFISCDENLNRIGIDNFDHEAQALIDNDTLTKFLNNYYFDNSVDSIKPLVTGQISLADDNTGNFKTINIEEDNIPYTIYAYIINKGGKDENESVINTKGAPTVVDSIFSGFSGQRILSSNRITIDPFDSSENGVWFTLDGVIRGWTHGISGNLLGGNNVTENGPITFENFGKAILIIPSGLAYRNTGTVDRNGNTIVFPNENLIFYINLFDIVKDTDHDNDGVPSIQEDANGDGNPRNDFSDPNFPTRPDYLNPNIK